MWGVIIYYERKYYVGTWRRIIIRTECLYKFTDFLPKMSPSSNRAAVFEANKSIPEIPLCYLTTMNFNKIPNRGHISSLMTKKRRRRWMSESVMDLLCFRERYWILDWGLRVDSQLFARLMVFFRRFFALSTSFGRDLNFYYYLFSFFFFALFLSVDGLRYGVY